MPSFPDPEKNFQCQNFCIVYISSETFMIVGILILQTRYF